MQSCHKYSGFSLIEMMVAIAVMAILLLVALPSFQTTMLSVKLRSYSNELVASIYLARSEAIKSNSTVTLCASSTGTSCDGEWNQGWIILNNNNVIQSHGALSSGFKISSDQSKIVFKSTGIGATQTTLTVCRAEPKAGDQERVVTISATGKPTVARTTKGSC